MQIIQAKWGGIRQFLHIEESGWFFLSLLDDLKLHFEGKIDLVQ